MFGRQLVWSRRLPQLAAPELGNQLLHREGAAAARAGVFAGCAATVLSRRALGRPIEFGVADLPGDMCVGPLKAEAFWASVTSSRSPSSIASPGRWSSGAPSHFFRIFVTLPRLAGWLRLSSTKVLKCAWVARLSTSAALLFAAIHRSLEAGSSALIWRRASCRSDTACCSSGSRAQGLASGLAPRGMCPP